MSKKRFYRFVYWVGFLFILTVTSSGQGVYEAWVASYNGPGNYDDYASALAIDASGNVYVTGRTWSGTSFDYATIKYDSNGDSLWGRHYNGPPDYYDYASALAVALAVDASGNVHVTGTSWNGLSYDYATIKYDSNGDSLWVRRYKGPGGNYGEAAPALAVDASGNVYVTGSSYCCGPGGSFNYTTIKYNSNGNLLWERHYNGPGNDYPDNIDIASALAVDASGNVYVTGRSYGSGTNYDYVTIKYAPNGDSLWVRRYNGPGNNFDEAIALAVDDSGNVYVTGQSGGGASNSYFTTTHDSTKRELV